MGLLYLGGYSLPAISDLVLKETKFTSNKELKNTVNYLEELKDIYANILEKVNDRNYKGDSINVENKSDCSLLDKDVGGKSEEVEEGDDLSESNTNHNGHTDTEEHGVSEPIDKCFHECLASDQTVHMYGEHELTTDEDVDVDSSLESDSMSEEPDIVEDFDRFLEEADEAIDIYEVYHMEQMEVVEEDEMDRILEIVAENNKPMLEPGLHSYVSELDKRTERVVELPGAQVSQDSTVDNQEDNTAFSFQSHKQVSAVRRGTKIDEARIYYSDICAIEIESLEKEYGRTVVLESDVDSGDTMSYVQDIVGSTSTYYTSINGTEACCSEDNWGMQGRLDGEKGLESVDSESDKSSCDMDSCNHVVDTGDSRIVVDHRQPGTPLDTQDHHDLVEHRKDDTLLDAQDLQDIQLVLNEEEQAEGVDYPCFGEIGKECAMLSSTAVATPDIGLLGARVMDNEPLEVSCSAIYDNKDIQERRTSVSHMLSVDAKPTEKDNAVLKPNSSKLGSNAEMKDNRHKEDNVKVGHVQSEQESLMDTVQGSAVNPTDNTSSTAAKSSNKKWKTKFAVQCFQPSLLSVNIVGIRWGSKQPEFGQMCLEKFLGSNPGLQRLDISWKGFTPEFIQAGPLKKYFIHNCL